MTPATRFLGLPALGRFSLDALGMRGVGSDLRLVQRSDSSTGFVYQGYEIGKCKLGNTFGPLVCDRLIKMHCRRLVCSTPVCYRHEVDARQLHLEHDLRIWPRASDSCPTL